MIGHSESAVQDDAEVADSVRHRTHLAWELQMYGTAYLSLSLLPLLSTHLKIDWINTEHHKNLDTIGNQEPGVEAELNFEFFEFTIIYSKLEIWGRAQHEAARWPTSDLKSILGVVRCALASLRQTLACVKISVAKGLQL